MTTQPTPEAGADLLDRIERALRIAYYARHLSESDHKEILSALGEYNRLRTQATGAGVGDVIEMRLCETLFLALRPDELYRFTVDPNCAKCIECAGLTGDAGRTDAPVAWRAVGGGCDHDWLPAFGYCSRCGIARPAATDAKVSEERINELHRMYWAAYHDAHKRTGRTIGGHDAGIRAIIAAIAAPQAPSGSDEGGVG